MAISMHRFTTSRMPVRLVCSLMIGALAPWPAMHAAKLTVCASGCDFNSIQSAVDGAKSGDQLKIKSGLFHEKVKITQKRLILSGEGANHTIIDGASLEDGRPVIELECQSHVKIQISDLTITGGLPFKGFGGGGINNSCSLTLEDSIVTNNAARGGGGILNSGSLELYGSLLSNNAAFDLSGGGIDNSGDLFIENSTIMNNSARNGGGGIASSGAMHLTSCIISNNDARLGGGIAVTTGSGEAQLREVAITNNTASGKGGGVWNGAQLEIKDSLIVKNKASGTSTERWGGGLFNATGGTLTLKDTTVTRNHADDKGGGLYNGGGAVSASGVTILAHNTPDNCFPSSCPR